MPAAIAAPISVLGKGENTVKADSKVCCTHIRRGLAGADLCVRERNNRVHLYVQPVPANPDTTDQRAARQGVRELAALWNSMPAESRDEWKAAARRLTPDFPQACGGLNGYTFFTQCAMNCAILGLERPQQPPRLARPAPPQDIELLPSDNPANYAFRVWHKVGIDRCRWYRVLTYLTPATAWLSRRPALSSRCLIHGYSAASAPQLPPSSQIIELTGAKIAVPAGSRFGVWMRVVHLPSGLASEEAFLDTIRS